jgi:hypothetical protein
VGDLAPWRAGPSEQAAVGAEPPMRGARDRARWAHHGWAARAGAGRGRAGPPRAHVRGVGGAGHEAGSWAALSWAQEGRRGRWAERGGGGREKGTGVGRPIRPVKGRGLIPFLFFFIYFYYFSLASCENH